MSLIAAAALALTMMQGMDTPATAPVAAEAARERREGLLDFWRRVLPGKTQSPLSGYRGDLIKTQKWSQGDWIIEVKKDGFADQIQCRIRPQQMLLDRGRVTFADGVMAFRFDGQATLAKVWFRIDDKPARPYRSLFRELHARGQTVMPYSPDYREDIFILIPAEELQGAQTVFIRPHEKGKPVSFNITGFSDAVDASRRVGCSDDSYVREDFN